MPVLFFLPYLVPSRFGVGVCPCAPAPPLQVVSLALDVHRPCQICFFPWLCPLPPPRHSVLSVRPPRPFRCSAPGDSPPPPLAVTPGLSGGRCFPAGPWSLLLSPAACGLFAFCLVVPRSHLAFRFCLVARASLRVRAPVPFVARSSPVFLFAPRVRSGVLVCCAVPSCELFPWWTGFSHFPYAGPGCVLPCFLCPPRAVCFAPLVPPLVFGAPPLWCPALTCWRTVCCLSFHALALSPHLLGGPVYVWGVVFRILRPISPGCLRRSPVLLGVLCSFPPLASSLSDSLLPRSIRCPLFPSVAGDGLLASLAPELQCLGSCPPPPFVPALGLPECASSPPVNSLVSVLPRRFRVAFFLSWVALRFCLSV